MPFNDKVVGVLGGGQLGRMLIESANRLNVQVNVLDAGRGPSKKIANHDGHVDGSFKDREAISRLAETSDVITIEIEHVDTLVLEELASKVDIQPSWQTIRRIQDKFAQKEHLISNGIATAESISIGTNDEQGLRTAAERLGLPFMLKAKKDAYDGRGNYPVKTEADFKPALEALGSKALYAEKWANFTAELAVMVVKTKDTVLAFPVVETVHEDSICKLVYAPARNIPSTTLSAAQDLARSAIACFDGKGVFGVEMFVLADSSLLINEIAPRPHNSGHYTIEACATSQYEAHLRAILDLPLDPASLRLEPGAAIMLNILGGADPASHLEIAQLALSSPRTRIHLYDKGDARPGRKMGHLTVTAPSMREAEAIVAPLVRAVDAQRAARLGLPTPSPPTDDDDAAARIAASARVAVIMGSDSDLPVLVPGLELLEKLGVRFTTRVTSAHRTPGHMARFVTSLRATHPLVEVVIAAAGGAAHLPGMAASHTDLVVVGVPVKPSVGDGWDSLVSMTNMPRGVPVATVGVNNGVNAAILAGRIIGLRDVEVRARLSAWVEGNEKASLDKDELLAQGRWRERAAELAKK